MYHMKFYLHFSVGTKTFLSMSARAGAVVNMLPTIKKKKFNVYYYKHIKKSED